jgi:hypothetical protein
MEHACHIVMSIIYMILCYIIGTGIDGLLYNVRSDRNRNLLIGVSSVFLLVGYMVGIYILIYLILNILA